jgi:hypothetical protein
MAAGGADKTDGGFGTAPLHSNDGARPSADETTMSQFESAYLAHQRQRWMRPDAHHFVRPDWQRHVRPGYQDDIPLSLYERKYSPDQPRDDHGRWTSGGVEVESILEMAKRLAATSYSDKYLRCLDVCSPILEIPQPPGADFNKWNFHRCMNACMGTQR